MVVVDMNLEASQAEPACSSLSPHHHLWRQALADKIDGTAIRANCGAEMDIRKVIVQVKKHALPLRDVVPTAL